MVGGLDPSRYGCNAGSGSGRCVVPDQVSSCPIVGDPWHDAYEVDPTSAHGTKRTWLNGRCMSVIEGILLQKYFWGDEQKFLEPLMRFTRGDVRDHIASFKIDHGPP
jgi:hypothetical protein